MNSLTCGHPFYHGCGDIPNDKADDIKKVRVWLQTQPDIPKLSNESIYMFLHSNHFDFEETKNTIQTYYSLRCTTPQLFLDQSPLNPNIQAAMKLTYMVPLPKTTPEGYKVIVLKIADTDPNKFIHLDSAKAMILFNDIRYSEDGIVPGYIYVTDARGYTWSHVTKINFHILRIYMKYMQEGKPVRLKAFHVIYSAKIVERVMNVMKPFMKSELQKMIKIHSGDDLTNFFKEVPQEIMPQDYGGEAESMATLHEKNKKLMETKYLKWVEEEELLLKEAMELRKAKKKTTKTVQSTEIEDLRNLSID